MENKIGSIELGKQADVAVWDRDIYTVPVDQVKDMKCRMTLLGGRIVYVAPDSGIRIQPPNVR